MCGGYYEEEFEMQGPAVQFKSEAGFHQAIGVCMAHLLPEEWTMDENLLRITFATPGVEQRYTIISTGLRNDTSTNPFLASQYGIYTYIRGGFLHACVLGTGISHVTGTNYHACGNNLGKAMGNLGKSHTKTSVN